MRTRTQQVEYAVEATAEACPLPDACADLVTVAQAPAPGSITHLARFYAEVRRVCKPRGIFAAWTYDLHSVNGAVDPILARFQDEFVDPYWPPERVWVRAGYRTIPFPFEEVPALAFSMTIEWDLPALLGYMNTWSALKRFEKANGFNPLGHTGERLPYRVGRSPRPCALCGGSSPCASAV